MKILIVAHVFYPEVWPELRRCIDVIRATADCRLVVTHSADRSEMEALIRQGGFDAELRQTGKFGYDIAPFLQVIDSVDLGEYDYVVKLHTKRTLGQSVKLPLKNVAGDEWRRMLLEFCHTEENWQSSLDMMRRPRVGMVADARVIFSMADDPAHFPRQGVDAAARQAGLPRRENCDFVGGSMFVVKASLLKPMQNKFSSNQFVSPNDHSLSFAHAVERLFGYVVEAQGETIADFKGRGAGFRYLCRLKKFLYSDYFSEKHHFVHIFGMRVLCLKRINKGKKNV